MFVRANNVLINIDNCHGIEITTENYIKFSFTQSNVTIPIKSASNDSILNEIENSIINRVISLDISSHVNN